jgi:hypothetical protein
VVHPLGIGEKKTAASEKPKAEDHHQNKELQGVL